MRFHYSALFYHLKVFLREKLSQGKLTFNTNFTSQDWLWNCGEHAVKLNLDFCEQVGKLYYFRIQINPWIIKSKRMHS